MKKAMTCYMHSSLCRKTEVSRLTPPSAAVVRLRGAAGQCADPKAAAFAELIDLHVVCPHPVSPSRVLQIQSCHFLLFNRRLLSSPSLP